MILLLLKNIIQVIRLTLFILNLVCKEDFNLNHDCVINLAVFDVNRFNTHTFHSTKLDSQLDLHFPTTTYNQ